MLPPGWQELSAQNRAGNGEPHRRKAETFGAAMRRGSDDPWLSHAVGFAPRIAGTSVQVAMGLARTARKG